MDQESRRGQAKLPPSGQGSGFSWDSGLHGSGLSWDCGLISGWCPSSRLSVISRLEFLAVGGQRAQRCTGHQLEATCGFRGLLSPLVTWYLLQARGGGDTKRIASTAFSWLRASNRSHHEEAVTRSHLRVRLLQCGVSRQDQTIERTGREASGSWRRAPTRWLFAGLQGRLMVCVASGRGAPSSSQGIGV